MNTHDYALEWRDNSGRHVWIGVAEVRQGPSCNILGESRGAFVNILALAINEQEYKIQAEKMAQYYGLVIVDYCDVEKFKHRTKRCDVNQEYFIKAQEVIETGLARCGTFHLHPEAPGNVEQEKKGSNEHQENEE